jgi:succinate dehydrogenase/fumarate reductase cytochrome b subunit
MENKRVILFCMFFIFWMFCVNSINAIDYNVSDIGVKYDKGIENKFIYQDRIYVVITIVDNSGIVYNGTKDERHEQWVIQNQWYQNEINNVIKSLSENDFILYKKGAVSFSGLISEEGFEKMKQREDIKAIELPGGGNGQSISNIFYLKWFVYFFVLLVIILIILLIKFNKIKKRREYVKKN